MTKNIAKKTIILYVLEMIEKGSSKEKPITITNITRALNSMGIVCERRTVGRNIDYLIEYGKPIVKIKGGGCYIKNNMQGVLYDVHKVEDYVKLSHENVEVVGFEKGGMIIKKSNGSKVNINIKEYIKLGLFSTDDNRLIEVLKKKGLY